LTKEGSAKVRKGDHFEENTSFTPSQKKAFNVEGKPRRGRGRKSLKKNSKQGWKNRKFSIPQLKSRPGTSEIINDFLERTLGYV